MRMPLPTRKRRQRVTLISAGLLLAGTSLLLALLSGSADIPPGAVLGHLFSNDGSIDDRIVDQLRLPRSLSAFAVGGVLALAGAMMQVLLRNPLGDPYVLGVSGGAASAVLGGMLLGLQSAWLTPLAFAGALLSMLLVFAVGHRASHGDTNRLLLTGVVMAAGWGALISLILSLGPPMRLPGMLFWLMGDLSDALSPWPTLFILALGLVFGMHLAPRLNLAVYGLQQAAVLGVNPVRLRVQLYFLASLLTAAAVSVAGAIGFVGLVTPHLVRLLGGSDHRLLLPVSVLLGGSLLTLADTAARTLISPMQLPVGVLTALLGVPVFLWLLTRAGHR
jgi:iron complex transport system permease protein